MENTTDAYAIILDTETTGIQEPVVPVEIAWEARQTLRGPVVAEFSHRYQPGKAIEYGAMATHKIIDADLADAPWYTGFDLPDGAAYLVGHNIDYDWKAIGSPDIRRICTLALARRLWTDDQSHALGALLFRFMAHAKARELVADAHGAAHDVMLTGLLLDAILEKMPKVQTWERLWEASEKARIPVVMPIGKHRGTSMADLPKDYVRWCLDNLQDLDPYLRAALEQVAA